MRGRALDRDDNFHKPINVTIKILIKDYATFFFIIYLFNCVWRKQTSCVNYIITCAPLLFDFYNPPPSTHIPPRSPTHPSPPPIHVLKQTSITHLITKYNNILHAALMT